MSRYIVIFSIALVVSIGSVQRATSQEDIERTLTRAQNLYYEARFKDSVDLLLPVDAALRQRPAPGGLTIGVKLQLALSYIGQNLTREAKAAFQEVCVLDPEYSLDSSQFSPKVIALFNDAKAEQEKIKCEARCGQIDKLSKSGDVAGLLTLADEASPGCSCVASAGAADVLFKQGLDAYRKDDFAGALEKFRGALKFRPDLDVAIQYAELADAKMTIATEQMLLDWRKHFAAREFPQAASVYRRLESSNIQGARPGLEQIRAEYRKAVAAQSRIMESELFDPNSCRTGYASSGNPGTASRSIPCRRPGFETGSMHPGADCSRFNNRPRNTGFGNLDSPNRGPRNARLPGDDIGTSHASPEKPSQSRDSTKPGAVG